MGGVLRELFYTADAARAAPNANFFTYQEANDMNKESPFIAAQMEGQLPHIGVSTGLGAVSWPAIVAGAIGAAALSLILLILGAGLGLASVSPWSDRGASAATLGVSTILWITLTQVAAAGMGGYLAGRLRARWSGTHTDEVYFRDTAHGFLAWSLATLVTAGLLTSAIGNIVGGAVKAGTSATGAVAATTVAALPAAANAMTADGTANSSRYTVDSLFRQDSAALTSTSAPAADPAAAASEVGRIFAQGLTTGTLATDDLKYVGQLIAQRTGLSQADAEKRVADGFNRLQNTAKEAEATARAAADKARKASAYAALWLFVSLLLGAFFASLAATYGGRRRDQF